MGDKSPKAKDKAKKQGTVSKNQKKAADFAKTLDQVKITTWHIMDTKVVWVDDKTAVVTYMWMGAGTYMKQPVPGMVYASTVWTERNGKWLAVFHQETAAAPPPKK